MQISSKIENKMITKKEIRVRAVLFHTFLQLSTQNLIISAKAFYLNAMCKSADDIYSIET